ncbi:erythromycin esterase family protein [Nonomuraea turkmeniaca]|uniref:Erythromycin esterase family protein n=1 Tax=Nonomuraea turkmeniaca TaxID=103838 RepID=A0A5S4F4Y1_9ACTN|nr:erythromycin esterase family protein [Nonomuraea turkmeniaca]TMR11231.1 erythromycin esterase family protein [Nonomuraea turkmeniaca]
MSSSDRTDPLVQDAASSLDGEGVAAVARLLRTFPARPRLLGLGEATHGEEALLELRNEIFRHLVEHEGYRSFALESDCLMGLAVDDYVETGTGTLDDVMARGFSHGFGGSAANRELMRWMRAYNEDRPAGERLRFFGFDAPLEMMGAAAPRQALTTLHGYLAAWLDADLLPCAADALDRLIGDGERWTNPAAAMDADQSVGQSTEARELRLIADDLVALLDAYTPHLIASTSRDEWWRASLHGRTATGLLRYHFWMADSSPARVWRLMALRDAMMADNLLAVAEHGPALVSAHNRHLQRDKSFWQLADMPLEWWSAGAIVSARLGDQYAFLASALGAMPHQALPAPHPGTVEGLLYTLPGNRSLIDARRLAAALAEAGRKPVPRTDISANYSYFALDPAHLGDNDGIVFVKDMPA